MKRFMLALLLILGVSAVAQVPFVVKNQFTATVGTSSSLAIPANNQRKYLLIQNTHASQTLKVRLGNAGTVGATIGAGGAYEPIGVPIDAIYVQGSGSGTTFFVLEGQ